MSERDRTPADAGPLALPAAGLRLAAAVSARPLLLLRRGGGWGAELGRVGLGRSDLAPDVPAGPVAPVARCVAQVLLATTGAVSGLLDDAVASPDMPLPAADAERLRATLAGLTSLLLPGAGPLVITGSAGAGAPDRTAATAGTGPGRQDDCGRAATVTDATAATAADTVATDTVATDTTTADIVTADEAYPAAAEAADRVFTPPGADTPSVPFDTGARDARGGPVPGRDVAATPGAVVLRTPMFELLQYLPRTEKVRDTPVLVVPPLVHRYWLADLAPGYSLVEHLLEKGLQVFALSWRPAGPADADRDLDAHAAAVLDAVDACGRITRAPRVSLLGVRTGGLLTAAVQAHQAAIGLDDRVAAVAYLATVLDQSDALPGFAPDPATVAETADLAARDGVLDGATAVRAWAWRRGPDRVLPWAVPHGGGTADLDGRAARAMRAWVADLLPLPAGLHTDLAALAAATGDGAAPDRPDVRVLGTPVRFAELRRDSYLVAADDDPVQPWTGGYRTAQRLGGGCRLVLAPGDQAGALIAPPSMATGFRAAPCSTGDGLAQRWRAEAEAVEGSWWDDLARWLVERSGTVRDAPPELGGRRLRPLFPAPGTYLGEPAPV
ncbi:alpha/beta hydrolase [Pseudonocardia sp. HH130629-09]|uniref:alpha/beta hydrolase n=1 Tax=Pseudonocardia sp. HH130629-09 TaxID=1641402 RepID=UPI0011AEC337|nr:alpha/beta hydrolase [Pseudonocardia sp. HH130629-09]